MSLPPWIKMRANLADDPHTIGMAIELEARGISEEVAVHTVVGLLHATWTLADDVSTDGSLHNYTTALVDRRVSFPGCWRPPVDCRSRTSRTTTDPLPGSARRTHNANAKRDKNHAPSVTIVRMPP